MSRWSRNGERFSSPYAAAARSPIWSSVTSSELELRVAHRLDDVVELLEMA